MADGRILRMINFFPRIKNCFDNETEPYNQSFPPDTRWSYYEGYKTTGDLKTRKSEFTDRNTALSHCVRHPLCQSVHYTHNKYYLRTGEKVSDALGDKAWILGSK